MRGDVRRHLARLIQALSSTSISARARRDHTTPVPEPLEGRQLLSTYTGYSRVRNILTSSGIYNLQINGPGLLKPGPAGNGSIDLKVLGTSTDSSLSITQVRPRFHVPNRLLSIQNLTIRSGQIGSIVAGGVELDGAMTPVTTSLSTLQFGALGPAAQIDVAGGIGSMNLGAVALGPNGHVAIAGDLNGSGQTGAMSIDTMSIDGGRFFIGRDSLAPITIAGNLSLAKNGLFSIGRDQVGSLAVGGSLILDTGGQLMVGRNLTSLSVNGDLLVNPGGGAVLVGGNLDGLTVNGIFRGQGTPSAIDLGVGLDLNGFSVLGGAGNQGGLRSANINVGKNINGLNVTHGIFQSWITAGVSLSGAAVGADGVVAVYNSEIDAGTSIASVTLGGDVKSGFPTGDPSGYPTRIIAGKTRDGQFLPNGSITGLSVSGALIDSVLAASVAPYGGDGSLPPPTAYGEQPRSLGPPPSGFSNYQAPAGLTDGSIKNYSIRNVVGGKPDGDAAWLAPVETRHDSVLDNGTVVATVAGGVVSTQHDDRFDFAGVFAVKTVGVNGGQQP
jgi:hypothetical protein